MLKELKEGAWIDYRDDWLPKPAADALFDELLENPVWLQKSIVANGKPTPQPRLMSWGGLLAYQYSGLTLEPQPMSISTMRLAERLNREWDSAFNHVVLNLYRNGKDHVSMHADNEPELGKDPFIASISLGETRRFVLKPKNKRFRRDQCSIDLKHGSLLIMGGTFQHRWRHALPPQPHRSNPRINITFRRLMGPPGWRSWIDGPDARHREKAMHHRAQSGLSQTKSSE